MSYSQAPPSYEQARIAPADHKKPSLRPGEEGGTYESLADVAAGRARDEESGAPLASPSASGEELDPAVRTMFVRKVYATLFAQVLLTTIATCILVVSGAAEYLQDRPLLLLTPIASTFLCLAGVFWKRHSHPANVLFLTGFTLSEAVLVGMVSSTFAPITVFKALVLTSFLFGALSLFALRSAWDLSQLGPWLWSSLWLLIGLSFVQIVMPFSSGSEVGFALLGALVFVGYIVFDTHLLAKRLHPDEFCLATVSLYLDLINLFFYLLRIVSGGGN